jgi:hypothetical protein
MVWTVSLLDRRVHDRKSFHCGIEPLDHYFGTQAAQDMAKRAAVCYVLEDEDMPGFVCGFYTLSNLSVELSEIPVAKRDAFPRYPQVPAILLVSNHSLAFVIACSLQWRRWQGWHFSVHVTAVNSGVRKANKTTPALKIPWIAIELPTKTKKGQDDEQSIRTVNCRVRRRGIYWQ